MIELAGGTGSLAPACVVFTDFLLVSRAFAGAFFAGAFLAGALFGIVVFLILTASRGAPIERVDDEATAAFSALLLTIFRVFAGVFFAGAFFAGAFFAGAFFAGAFFAGAFFAGALFISSRTRVTAIRASRLVTLAFSATASTSCVLFMPIPVLVQANPVEDRRAHGSAITGSLGRVFVPRHVKRPLCEVRRPRAVTLVRRLIRADHGVIHMGGDG
jgi:hypothetical protein